MRSAWSVFDPPCTPTHRRRVLVVPIRDSRLVKKGPGFKFVKGIAIERPENPPTVTRGEQQFQAMMQSRRLGETMARTADFRAGSGAGVPSYVKDARSVLRFETYFMEAVHESPTEKYRVRKITLLYYLEDHTLQVRLASGGIKLAGVVRLPDSCVVLSPAERAQD